MEPSCNTSEGHLPFIDLPIIDIVRLCGRSGDVDRAAESQKLVDAFTNVGFCLLKNMTGIGSLIFGHIFSFIIPREWRILDSRYVLCQSYTVSKASLKYI